jgi:hypothetical protein
MLMNPAKGGMLVIGDGTDRVLVCHDGLLIPLGLLDANLFR